MKIKNVSSQNIRFLNIIENFYTLSVIKKKKERNMANNKTFLARVADY